MERRDRFVSRRTAINGVIAVEASSDRRLGRHMHDQFGIGLVLAGAQDSLSGRGEVQARAGDLITVNPGEVHDGRPVDGTVRQWRMLYLDPGPVARIARGFDLSSGTELQHPVLHDPHIARAFLALHADLLRPGGVEDGAAIEGAMMAVLAPLFGVAATHCGCVPAGIRHARAAIDDDPATPRSLGEMSRLAGLDRYRFLRTFKAATGLPPHAYRIQRQLQMARRLIVSGMPVAPAAAEAGFADQAHLTRHFTRAYGIRPGALAAAFGGAHRRA